ncbi:MAG TPA: hypothetical protein VMT71_10840 [Syntrophorhabdales bacterium]|nr:hypothetical protein [Syntrophorhabdales bacterium]
MNLVFRGSLLLKEGESYVKHEWMSCVEIILFLPWNGSGANGALSPERTQLYLAP